MSRYRSYILSTCPRSGSTLLCHMLRATGVAGHPGSHFHRLSLAAWLEAYDLHRADFDNDLAAARAVIAAGIAHGRGEADLFALRLQWHSFDFFISQLTRLYPDAQTDLARIEAAFGKTFFIHLTRGDKLDQAISYVKAQQSGLWHKAPDGREIERLSAPAQPVYDRAAIAAQIETFTDMDTAWEAWFGAQNITPLRLSYDALSADPFGTRAQVLDALGLSYAPPPAEEPPVAKLADTMNADWRARFLGGP